MVYETVGTWLKAIIDHGDDSTHFTRADDAKKRLLGIEDRKGRRVFQIPLVKVTDRTAWDIKIPQRVELLFRTPNQREILAEKLSRGEIQLDFSELDSGEDDLLAQMERDDAMFHGEGN